MAGCGFQGKASGFLQDINHISWVHERFEAYLTAGSVRTAGFINASVTATDDVGGGIDGVAKTIDNLAIEFGLAWSKYVQTNDFGFCERRVAPNQYQHAIALVVSRSGLGHQDRRLEEHDKPAANKNGQKITSSV